MTNTPTTGPPVEPATAAILDAGMALTRAGAQLTAAGQAMADTIAELRAGLDSIGIGLADTRARVTRLETSTPPPPPPDPDPVPVIRDVDLWTGPTWTGPFPATSPADYTRLYRPTITPTRAAFGRTSPAGDYATLTPDTQGGVRLEMRPATLPAGSRVLASTSEERWLPFDQRYTRAGFEVDVMFPAGFSWPKTGKWGGIVGWDWDPTWATWPGGGRPNGRNSSVRLTYNDYDHRGRPRLAAYLYLSGLWSDNGIQLVGSAKANNVSNGGHTVEILLDEAGPPLPGRYITTRFDVDCDSTGRGGLNVEVDGETVLTVLGVPWFTDPKGIGWNVGYISAGFGGDTPDFLPTTPAPWFMNYRNARWYHREARP